MSTIRNSKTKTFGILTSGGDCPGLNAAIRGVCRAAHDRYGMKIIGIADGFRGLINGNVHPLNPIDFSGILTRGGTILGSSREKPFKHTENGPSVGYRVAKEKNYYMIDTAIAVGTCMGIN